MTLCRIHKSSIQYLTSGSSNFSAYCGVMAQIALRNNTLFCSSVLAYFRFYCRFQSDLKKKVFTFATSFVGWILLVEVWWLKFDGWNLMVEIWWLKFDGWNLMLEIRWLKFDAWKEQEGQNLLCYLLSWRFMLAFEWNFHFQKWIYF